MIQQRARGFTAFGILLGVAGFVGLGLRVVSQPAPTLRELMEAGALILLAGLSWRYSFSILSRSRFSLDLAYMVKALLCQASPVPVIVGAGTAILGSFLRPAPEAGRPHGDLAGRMSFLLVNTGTLIAMMLAGEVVVRDVLGGQAAVRRYGQAALSFQLVFGVASVFCVLMAVNLTLMGLSAAIRGDPVKKFLSHHARHVLPLEIFNIPLAILMISVRIRDGFLAFTLLASLALAASFLLKSLNRAHERLSGANVELALRAEELSTLNSIGREISSSLDLSRVFRTIYQRVARLLDAPTFAVALYDRELGLIRHACLVRSRVPQEPSGFPLGSGVLSWIIRSGRPLRLDHARQTVPTSAGSLYDLTELDPAARSLLAMPLYQLDGEVMGVLAVASPLDEAYTSRHESMLSSIALHASIAIENARYYEMATIDRGTRLFFKDYFMQRLEEETSRARRYQRPFTVLMMDLDGFKRINDEYGHQPGDVFLWRVGEAIRSSLRSIDIASRYGGEEFSVLLPETDHDEGMVIAERIRRRVAEIRVEAAGRTFGTTISIGIASYPRCAWQSAEDLIRQADLAMYRAKREGKNKVISAGAS